MEPVKDKNILISGASIAGLSAAYCLNKLGYRVTVVEIAIEPRTAGGAIDIRGGTIDIAKRMGIYDRLKSHGLTVEKIEFKDAGDVTVGGISMQTEGEENPEDGIEIERDKFIGILYEDLKNDVEFIFNNSITTLNETEDEIQVTFKDGSQRAFHLVIGCDGSHSGVRKIWFGPEKDYAHFLEAYFSITIVNKLLVKQKTMQMYNVPDKGIMLNAYNNKTDVIFCFYSENEIAYNYRDTAQQRVIILEQFAGQGWRTAELLEEIKNSEGFYFDKFCQIKMPTWTKGRVALVGDAAYCASPAAGMGGSLAMEGAAALADALEKHNGNFDLAFRDYEQNLRPFIEEVQATAEQNMKESFILRTEEAINKRNAKTDLF
jgi:2-polyprenyl-6-methoxyphenol hydroxylase-like FAD-dependent oxidoreductase